MALPHSRKLGKVILEFLNDGELHTISSVVDHIADVFGVPNDERQERTKKSNSLKLDIRIRWVVSELRKALLLENQSQGVFKITKRGLDVLKEDPSLVDRNYLKRFSEFSDWLENTSNIDKISKKIEKEKPKKKFGLVAYIDVLGTKEFWKNPQPEDILKTWSEFTKKFNDMISLTFKEITDKLTFNSFSDTIIITIEHSDTNNLLRKFGPAVWNAIVMSIKLNIPIRGCFSLGTFYHQGNFFIGEAITEAAQYYELPQWIGISAAPSANLALEKLSKKIPSISAYFQKCSIPLKTSIEQDAWAIKWPELYEVMRITNESEQNSPHVLELIDSKLDESKNIDVALKWRNTRKFYDDVINPSQLIE